MQVLLRDRSRDALHKRNHWPLAVETRGATGLVKVEVTIGRTSAVFVGIGPVGRTRRFDWSTVTTIREDSNGGRGSSKVIVLEGKDRLSFGTGLNESRRYFLLRTLKQLRRGA